MTKFPEAEFRLFKNVFVCRACKRKTRVSGLKVSAGKASCGRCGSAALRPVRKK